MAGYKIAEARIAKGWTQSELAEKIGTTQQQIARYESGANDVKSSVLIKMSSALDVTLSYLLGLKDTAEASSSDDHFKDVPVYGSIAAGTPIEMIETDGSFPVPSKVMGKYPDSFLLKVKGNSMDRVLPDGCYALIDPCETINESGKAYAVCVNGFDATIKRVKKLANGFELVPDSTDPTYKPVVYDYGVEGTETITVIGRVVYYVLPYDWNF